MLEGSMEWVNLLKSWQELDCDLVWHQGQPANEAEISKLESRLNVKLPPSYKQFLKVANGCGNEWCRLNPVDEVVFLRENEPELANCYQHEIGAEPSVTDELYFVYGEKQDCCHVRFEYLVNALQISNEIGGLFSQVYLLLIPEVISATGEWEAWHFGPKFPGAFRYQSFEDMITGLIERKDFSL
jgi:SMI1 / KNR4 family (SUKH-1)